MKRLFLLFAFTVGCSSDPEPVAVTSYPLCDAEEAWLARCPSASECARVAVAACRQVSAQVSSGYVDTASNVAKSAACDAFDSIQLPFPAQTVEEERTKVAKEFCDECRPGLADCVTKFYAGDDLGTGTASLILTMSDKNVHELNNRWPSATDAGTCEGTFKQIVLTLFNQRVPIHLCE